MQFLLNEIPKKEAAAIVRTLNLKDMKAEKGALYPIYSVGVFPNLEFLSADGCDAELINEFLADINLCTKLAELKLMHCNLTSLPAAIYKCKNLKIIKLNSNKLTKFPVKLLVIKKLKEIDVTYNKIAFFPAGVAEWSNKASNKLTTYDNCFGISNAHRSSFYGELVKIEEIDSMAPSSSPADNNVLTGDSVGIKLTFSPCKDIYRYIYLLISNDQQCCENVGSIILNDNPQEFIGAKFLGLSRVLAGDLKSSKYTSTEKTTVFLNVATDKGDLQFAVYNDHDGYYGHLVRAVVANEIGENHTYFSDDDV